MHHRGDPSAPTARADVLAMQVVIDTLHLLPKTNRHARLLYDDVCDTTDCTAVEPMVLGALLRLDPTGLWVTAQP